MATEVMNGAVAAAIRRASQAARNGMQALDERAVAELTRIYTEAAAQVQAAIEAAAAAGGSRVKLEQLQGLLANVTQVLDALASASAELINAALVEAAELGVRPLTEAGLAATGRAVPSVLTVNQALEQVDTAVAFVQNFRAADGLVLSDRLWRVGAGARQAVLGTIEQAVVQGWSADKAAQEFILRGQAVPAGTQQAQQAAQAARLMVGADYLRDASSGGLAAALRVMRTEVNRAHGEAYMASAEKAPGFVGFRFLLSPRHPRPDICDLYARQNVHGLGEGVYPDRKSCPWPAHPNTISFVVAVFDAEVSEADQAGRETTMEALERLGPEIRAGALGQTKAEYFDQGLLATGMVRSRLRDVRERLGRRG
ncbi:MAG: hypothetical protein C0423_13935 [Methylibium sp.]|nr:hypothetical protein [Methylibium sp.]